MDGDIKHSKLWMRDSLGKRSASVTLLWISFAVTTIAYLASMFESIGPVNLRAFDVSATSTYFIPILTMYAGRKWTKAKYTDDTEPTDAPEILNG